MDTVQRGMVRLFAALSLAGAVGITTTGWTIPAEAPSPQSAPDFAESRSHGDLEAALITVTSDYPVNRSLSESLPPETPDPLEWCRAHGVDDCSDIRNYLATKSQPTPWDDDRLSGLVAMFQSHALEQDAGDDDELQKSSLVPTCPPGTSFVEAYEYGAASIGVPLRGACKAIGSPGKVGSVALWGEEDLEELSSQAPVEALSEQPVRAFDIDDECIATLGLDPQDGDARTVQFCPDDAVTVDPADPSRSIPQYIVPVPVDSPALLHLCVLAHPEEVSGSAEACNEPEDAGAANISTASLTTSRLTAEEVDTVGEVALNGTILDPELEVAGGHAHVALPALSLGVHHVWIGFTANGLTTYVEVLVDAQDLAAAEAASEANFRMAADESADPTHTDGAENSPALLYPLGGLLAIALLITLWMLVAPKVTGRRG